MTLAIGRWSAVAALCLALSGGLNAAAGIKLITLPPRERVEVQLDHPAVTLVEEERVVPLNAGVNDVVFAWNNTQIDINSIQFRCLSDPDNIKVLSASYPPQGNELTWQVAAPQAGSARVRISYIIGQLNQSYQYRALAEPNERELTLWQYMDLHNNANEEFGFAGMWTGFGEAIERPIGIAETKQVLAAKFVSVPITKTYTADLASYGYLDAGKKQLRIPMHYVLVNDDQHGLGQFPLMPGKVRIFQDDGAGTSAFLGEDWAGFTPLDDKVRLYLGVAQDVVVKRNIMRREAQRVRGNLMNYDVIVKYEIENFKDAPVQLDIAETLSALRNEIGVGNNRPVEWVFGDDGTLKPLLNRDESTADRLVFQVPLPARAGDQKAQKVEHTLHIIIRNEW